ncbi:MAG TPA: helix-turn-helix transcriptional regulator [Solirubrobacteraceae bacterium]|jgi:transcriptional regulator with XRE-family HTH domain
MQQTPGIGARITEAREAAGLTRTQLGAKAGYAAATIEAWEKDRRYPTLGPLRALARILGRDISWFYEPLNPAGDEEAA